MTRDEIKVLLNEAWGVIETLEGKEGEINRYLGGMLRSGRLPVSRQPLQRPTFFYPGLTDQPVWDVGKFPWGARVRDAAADIRQEYLALRPSREGFASILPELVEGDWAALWLWQYGIDFPDNIRRCPRTMAALSDLKSAGWGGFSVMKPNTHVLAHCGMTNAKLRVHVPLVVPRGCRMRVGSEVIEWQEGEPIVFDDSYEHEVWTTVGEPRAIFMFDIFHPDLDEEEVRLLARLDPVFSSPYRKQLERAGQDKNVEWL